MRLQDKIAVVTGGSSGIGLATARRFAHEGARHVFITGRRATELTAAAHALGDNVTAVPGDIADLSDLDGLVDAVGKKAGSIDIVVSGAGFVEPLTLEHVSPEHYDRTFAVNTRGTFFLVQRLLPLIRDHGSVVLISSAVHRMGVPAYTTYSASKAAMRSFARTWAAELTHRHIRVNAISPGSVDTPAIDAQFPAPGDADAARAQMAADNPLGRIAQSEEIASAALFLASDEAGYITGADLPVDGGQTQL